MAVQGEELASKIEEKIKQAIDSVVEDIRVSIDDVRDVVNQQFDAVLQSVLADAKAMSVRAELDEMLAGQVAPPPAAPPETQAEPGLGSRELKKAIQQIERGGTQVDVLNALLEQLLEFGSRAALLILKSDTFSGWKGKGFSSFGGQDEFVKRLSAGPGEIRELDRLRLEEKVVSWDGGSFAQKLGITPAASALVVPMVIKDKISAAVYVDRMPDSEGKLDQAAVELLVFATGLLIDTLAIRKKVPSPTLSRETDAEPFESEEPEMLAHGQLQAPEPATPASRELTMEREQPAPPRTEHDKPVPEVEEPSAPRPASTGIEMPSRYPEQIEPPRPKEEPSPVEPTPTELRSVEPPPAETPSAPPAAATSAPATPVEPTPPEAPQPSAPPPTQVKPKTGGSGESTQYVPPPGVKGGFAARAEMGEDAKKHDDARRFARLLVSEIKLYNEGKVDQGRKNGDLYERLKEDIDRSRQMYEDRVPSEVRDVSNYFYDELVRILADGNTDALGL